MKKSIIVLIIIFINISLFPEKQQTDSCAGLCLLEIQPLKGKITKIHKDSKGYYTNVFHPKKLKQMKSYKYFPEKDGLIIEIIGKKYYLLNFETGNKEKISNNKSEFKPL